MAKQLFGCHVNGVPFGTPRFVMSILSDVAQLAITLVIRNLYQLAIITCNSGSNAASHFAAIASCFLYQPGKLSGLGHSHHCLADPLMLKKNRWCSTICNRRSLWRVRTACNRYSR